MFRRFFNYRWYRSSAPARPRPTDSTRLHNLAGNLGLLHEYGGFSYLIFNGTNAYVELPLGNIIPYMHDFTIEFWFKPESDTNHQRIFAQSSNAKEPLTISFVNECVTLFGGVAHNLLWTGLEDPTWAWRHYAFVRKGSLVKGYKEGMLVSQDSDPTEGTSLINGFGSRDGTRDFLSGYLSEFRIWNFAMPVWQIYAFSDTATRPDDPRLFAYWPLNEGSGTSIQDVTGNGWDGVAYNCTWSA